MADGSSVGTPSELARRVLRQTTAYAALRAVAAVATLGAFVALSRILDQRSFGAFEIGMFYIGLGQILGDGGSRRAWSGSPAPSNAWNTEPRSRSRSRSPQLWPSRS